MKSIETLEAFEQAIHGDKRALIKFEADWCPDCKRLNMFIDEIIEDHNEFNWYEINRDHFPELGEKYEVMGIPSLLVFDKGEKKAHLHSANAKSPEEVRAFLDSVE
ncbi:thiol-disulfide isomerase/thioredoxin [Pullulanibacillus pueri]|uniref:Thioredoxin-like protein YdbP n=1 Tax=Pullulanibacillus pueri TaxID=1437324 RepID=A0A8J3EL25_9BACL|nr:thioredoxin family protein [Pullulanibacillus pueri]MBM7681639.1 thiol-disulfide isomerase/thioredoxin [Pullulanibacillus pueri]GGH79350.1 thioredoxin-like protein YdbP [Pullulanibacillus pueri]